MKSVELYLSSVAAMDGVVAVLLEQQMNSVLMTLSIPPHLPFTK
eukprot:CAMPEP_0194134588 /NCGR_PEP_ID=MMETSP0152-20130528/4660_1 /TAXON_ID=1049557 /ORGANISM="Thalassiothrix antarctica, Strain L6-D1" /LENGTH=43 /DNA_ID= /DNA_START= /DNA_END= /DNA_ORIENTATION=